MGITSNEPKVYVQVKLNREERQVIADGRQWTGETGRIMLEITSGQSASKVLCPPDTMLTVTCPGCGNKTTLFPPKDLYGLEEQCKVILAWIKIHRKACVPTIGATAKLEWLPQTTVSA